MEPVARQVLDFVIQTLAPQADAIFVREPLIDPGTPGSSDLDLLVFGPVDELLPERMHLPEMADSHPPIDLIWLPTQSLDNPDHFARNGVIPHRLLSSGLVYDARGIAARQHAAVRERMYQDEIQCDRIKGFLDMGFYTVREIGVTWDFPAMALFWLHVAYSACLAAICDALRCYCPNVYTRPFDYLRNLTVPNIPELRQGFIESLHLDADAQGMAQPLRRIHAVVSRRFPEPRWPRVMRQTTRYEYRYFSARSELDWRLQVAEELAAGGDAPAAVYYLRFWAYVLARLPMVYQRAKEGHNVSFMRPARAVRPDLEANCPEIMDDLTRIHCGSDNISIDDVVCSLDRLYDLRKKVLDLLEAQDIKFANLPDWRPHRAPPHH